MEVLTTPPLGKRIVFVGKALRAHFEASLATAGSSLATWAVLSQVAAMPGMSQTQLADCVGIEGATLVRHLDRMCAEGLVERRRDERDRRVTRIVLTPSGRTRHRHLLTVAQRVDEELRSVLGDEGYVALGHLLQQIEDHVEGHHAEVSH